MWPHRAPIFARDHFVAKSEQVAAINQVRIIAVRSGKIRLEVVAGEILLSRGWIALIPARKTFQLHPIDGPSLTCIYLEPEYAVDLIYWQYRAQVSSRIDALILANRLYSSNLLTVALGPMFTRIGPVLDEMVALSATGDFSLHANRIQASWFTLAHAISTCGGAAPERGTSVAAVVAPVGPTPIRQEVAHIAALLESTPDREWRLQDLAEQVHLSPGHLSRLCVAAWGRTPRAQLAFIRVERLAHLLRETNEPVERCIHTVGWRNHGHAVSIFRRMMGMSPSEYRGRGRRQDPEVPDGSEHMGSPFQPF